ncbi:PASTA domain-containing protein [Actinosynnema sp. CS-041913]|uniref:PASTA domain-containing protein n=1 Tax=Actinosynnema sp. CS-041913 TaxID=3239917 RepID=UPI003D8EA923
MRLTRLVAVLPALAVLAACTTTPDAQPPTGVTTPPITPPQTPPPTTPPAAPPQTTTPPAATAKTCTVPDVVGMVHQTAQDTMQAAGLYRLREEDATGQGRLLVADRNWTTTAQSVRAGDVVDCTTEILLSAKKTGE